ncbi:protein Lines homolog 1 [Hoplias malabaricus]|uniref:protein Lines homolog 1 n=1 Tax=Hoplias malabaricus TaxID=27720 RepID=UPI0034626189
MEHPDFQALFTALRARDIPGVTSEELATRIKSVISQSLQPLSPHRGGSKETDSACLCLTLIGQIIAALSSKSLLPDARTFYEAVMKTLFGPADLMSELVSLLNSQDRLLSHLTSKCVSSVVLYDLCNHGDVNTVWKATCAETFQKSAPSHALDTCLWSLTEVIKGVLRGDCTNKQEILTELLAGLEAPLDSLYSEVLIRDKCAQTPTDERDLDVSVGTLLDLLEALCAARLRFGLCSSAQRLLFFHTSALLRLVHSGLKYCVKKRVLLLLKRAMVQRPGEDWRLGEGHSAVQGDEFLSGDMLSLAGSVLQGVSDGWLRKVYVKPQPSFLGGSREMFPEAEGKDAVMLRALSLVVIKSLEIVTKHPDFGGADRAVDVQRCLLELLSFLQEHVGQLKAEAHLCSWISLVFGEQDDDMMEAAKALTALYLCHRSVIPSGPEACSCGCNPHCHFILLLQSVSFDHTVLLDFLISAETCFLEYCVLYLKHLRDNRQGFSRSCSRIEDKGWAFRSCETGRTPLSLGSAASLEGTSGASQARERHTSVGSRPRLVDYGSSEESEEEGETVPDLHTKRKTEESRADCDVRVVSTRSLLEKVTLCLSELKAVITKLHSRGLFPYNPASLLKLLVALEAKRQS